MQALQVFQDRLLLTRRRRQMTQEALAEVTHLFKSDISKYERGTSLPTLPRLIRLADALTTSADYLLGRTTEESI